MNIKAVARRAGVSTATVSRVINGSEKVTPETAEKVRRAVEALQFFPNTNARALGTGRTSLYGLIISDITNPFFPELVRAFEDIAMQHGQEVLIANTNYDPRRMETCIGRMVQRKVDGLAIMTSEMDDRLLELVALRQIPLVSLDGAAPGPWRSSVRLDYESAVRQALEHLTGLGHRRIAFLSGPQRLASARARLLAFQSGLARHHLKLDPRLIAEGNHRVEGGREAMRLLLEGLGDQQPPTAVLASNDLTAIGAMGVLAERGLRVPEEVSVMGFDDIELSAYTMPALTTMRLSRKEIAAAAFAALRHNRETARKHHSESDPSPEGEQHIVSPSLVLRSSTAPARG